MKTTKSSPLRKYHLHVYKVIGKAELDILARDEVEAREKALQLVGELVFQKSDCKYVVFSFKNELNHKHCKRFKRR
ncbi:MAG: hypothetical protein DRN95_03790 [Candidatus Hydrothermarchaeota archaeon]|nr:MAG: hypothetical protein DRN95_03790 [Candidatus Hydrothermarchaeota archaeon]